MSKGKHFDFECILFSSLHFSFLIQFKLNLQVVFMSLGRVKKIYILKKTCCPYCSLRESEILKFPRVQLWLPLGSAFSILGWKSISFPQHRRAREAEPRRAAGSQLACSKPRWTLRQAVQHGCSRSSSLTHIPASFQSSSSCSDARSIQKKRREGSSQAALRWCLAAVRIDRHC